MNYYHMKTVVAKKVQEWLQERSNNPKGADSYPVFMRKLELEFGVGDVMVRKMLERYHLTIKDNELVKLEEVEA